MATTIICLSKKKFPREYKLPYVEVDFADPNARVTVEDHIADQLIEDNPLLFKKVAWDVDDPKVRDKHPKSTVTPEESEEKTPDKEDPMMTLTKGAIVRMIQNEFEETVNPVKYTKEELVALYHEKAGK